MKIASDHAWQDWLDLVFAEDGPPDWRTRLVLAALAVRVRADQRFPSMTELVRMTALSYRVVAKLISDAMRVGWITDEELRRIRVTDDAVRLVTSDDLVTLQ